MEKEKKSKKIKKIITNFFFQKSFYLDLYKSNAWVRGCVVYETHIPFPMRLEGTALMEYTSLICWHEHDQLDHTIYITSFAIKVEVPGLYDH